MTVSLGGFNHFIYDDIGVIHLILEYYYCDYVCDDDDDYYYY